MKTTLTALIALAALLGCTRNEAGLEQPEPSRLIPVSTAVSVATNWDAAYEPKIELDTLGLLTPLFERHLD